MTNFLSYLTFFKAYKIQLEISLLKILALRLFFVVMARICLHFGYDILDIFEEFTEGTYYFLFFSKKLMVWEAKAQAWPVYLRRLSASYYWAREFLLIALVFAVSIPWLKDKYKSLFFSLVAKTRLSGWYDVEAIDDDFDKEVLKDNKKYRRIEYLIKYRETRIKKRFMKLLLHYSLYKKAKVLYNKRAYNWFFKRSNFYYRTMKIVDKKLKKRPTLFLFNFRRLRAYLKKKLFFWKVTSRRF